MLLAWVWGIRLTICVVVDVDVGGKRLVLVAQFDDLISAALGEVGGEIDARVFEFVEIRGVLFVLSALMFLLLECILFVFAAFAFAAFLKKLKLLFVFFLLKAEIVFFALLLEFKIVLVLIALLKAGFGSAFKVALLLEVCEFLGLVLGFAFEF